LGAATSVGIYDYLGYYDICYMGGEARNPGKVIPRSIVLSLLVVAAIYVTMSLCIMGVVPWRSFVARPGADPVAIGSLFMRKIWGVTVARVFAFLVLWTVFGSIFTLALGYSRVPYAAARDGCFFRVFGRLHPTKNFPHVSLALIVGLSILFSFVGLGTLIGALLALRVIVQFLGQIVAVWRLRRLRPDMPRPFRIWLYPLPSLVALGGWCFIFLTTGWKLQLGALAALGAGIAAFLVWSRATRKWPFGQKP
jgi:amino acid transporter